jgi:hypothetical protein
LIAVLRPIPRLAPVMMAVLSRHDLLTSVTLRVKPVSKALSD